ncbi:MAG: Jag N-terminal domain-containing protein [Sulfurovum sp.]|nr:Jag N-terminal domain-containing protein [Sulfurovum sp.]MCB4783835.1 Jag N-terminal domain-containing protein [Sulfurovum sp.]
MTKVEASTLEEAYRLVATKLSCSVTELQYEVIQYPSKGLFGLFKKQAIVVATRKKILDDTNITSVATEKLSSRSTNRKKSVQEDIIPIVKSNTIVENFFNTDNAATDVGLAQSIEKSLKYLMKISCFDIDVVEVDVVDSTALIFIDGEDAALLIGKEGYRYNALSYMLSNWLHTKYQFYVKLEIAEFLTSQQEMIRNYIQPVIENVRKYGKGKTRFFDGILVQIALEQLREAFPDKYVAIKIGKSGKRFVVVNEFHTKSYD